MYAFIYAFMRCSSGSCHFYLRSLSISRFLCVRSLSVVASDMRRNFDLEGDSRSPAGFAKGRSLTRTRSRSPKGLPLTRMRSRSPSSATFTPCASDEEEPPKTHKTDNARASTSPPSGKSQSKESAPRRLKVDDKDDENSHADYPEAEEAEESSTDQESEPSVRDGPVRRSLSWPDFNYLMKDLNFTMPDAFLHKTDPMLDSSRRKNFIQQVFLRQDQWSNTSEQTDEFFQAFKRTDESMECENLVRWIIENGIVRCCQVDWTILFEKCFALILLYVDKQSWMKAKKTGQVGESVKDYTMTHIYDMGGITTKVYRTTLNSTYKALMRFLTKDQQLSLWRWAGTREFTYGSRKFTGRDLGYHHQLEAIGDFFEFYSMFLIGQNRPDLLLSFVLQTIKEIGSVTPKSGTGEEIIHKAAIKQHTHLDYASPHTPILSSWQSGHNISYLEPVYLDPDGTRAAIVELGETKWTTEYNCLQIKKAYYKDWEAIAEGSWKRSMTANYKKLVNKAIKEEYRKNGKRYPCQSYIFPKLTEFHAKGYEERLIKYKLNTLQEVTAKVGWTLYIVEIDENVYPVGTRNTNKGQSQPPRFGNAIEIYDCKKKYQSQVRPFGDRISIKESFEQSTHRSHQINEALTFYADAINDHNFYCTTVKEGEKKKNEVGAGRKSSPTRPPFQNSSEMTKDIKQKNADVKAEIGNRKPQQVTLSGDTHTVINECCRDKDGRLCVNNTQGVNLYSDAGEDDRRQAEREANRRLSDFANGKIVAAVKSLSKTCNKKQTASASCESHRAASVSQAEVISPSTARNKNAEKRIAPELASAESMKEPSSPRRRSSSKLHAGHVSRENAKRLKVRTSSIAQATAAKPPCKSSIETHIVTDSVRTVVRAGSSQSQATFSSSNQRQERTPAGIYDTGFLADQKKKSCKLESLKDTESKPSSPRGRWRVSPENVERSRVQTSAPLSAKAHVTASKSPSIDIYPVGTVAYAGSSQSQATSSSSNQQKELTPAAIYDTRFQPNKKKKECICDNCRKLVKYGHQGRPFEGNFLCAKEVPAKYANEKWNLETKEKAWNAGLWNATWYCVECLAEHHQKDLAYVRSNYIGDFAQQRAKAKAKMQAMVKQRLQVWNVRSHR